MLESRFGEGGGVVGPWSSGGVGGNKEMGFNQMGGDEGFEAMVDSVDVGHPSSRSVNDGEIEAQKFLAPSSDKLDVAGVLEDLFDRRAIT